MRFRAQIRIFIPCRDKQHISSRFWFARKWHDWTVFLPEKRRQLVFSFLNGFNLVRGTFSIFIACSAVSQLFLVQHFYVVFIAKYNRSPVISLPLWKGFEHISITSSWILLALGVAFIAGVVCVVTLEIYVSASVRHQNNRP